MTETRIVKARLDPKLYGLLLLHKRNDDEGVSEIVAKALCKYFGIDTSNFDIPALKDSKAKMANSWRNRTDL